MKRFATMALVIGFAFSVSACCGARRACCGKCKGQQSSELLKQGNGDTTAEGDKKDGCKRADAAAPAATTTAPLTTTTAPR